MCLPPDHEALAAQHLVKKTINLKVFYEGYCTYPGRACTTKPKY